MKEACVDAEELARRLEHTGPACAPLLGYW
jgi:hypothetical protein